MCCDYRANVEEIKSNTNHEGTQAEHGELSTVKRKRETYGDIYFKNTYRQFSKLVL